MALYGVNDKHLTMLHFSLLFELMLVSQTERTSSFTASNPGGPNSQLLMTSA